MNPIGWALLGLVAGALAKMIYPGTQGGGWLSTIALGIAGSFLGGTLYTFITMKTFAVASAFGGVSIPSFIFAVLGSMVAIFLWGLVTGNA